MTRAEFNAVVEDLDLKHGQGNWDIQLHLDGNMYCEGDWTTLDVQGQADALVVHVLNGPITGYVEGARIIGMNGKLRTTSAPSA